MDANLRRPSEVFLVRHCCALHLCLMKFAVKTKARINVLCGTVHNNAGDSRKANIKFDREMCLKCYENHNLLCQSPFNAFLTAGQV